LRLLVVFAVMRPGLAFWLLTAFRRRLPEAAVAALAAGRRCARRTHFLGWRLHVLSFATPGAEASNCAFAWRWAGARKPSSAHLSSPNISQHGTDGIGAWSLSDLANAMQMGVSPDGSHYYPAFPFTSYARMKLADIADLYAFMKMHCRRSRAKAPGHELGFPVYAPARHRPVETAQLVAKSRAWRLQIHRLPTSAGQYLVEGPGHCGECHTPRDFTGGVIKSKWLSGAVAAEGDGNRAQHHSSRRSDVGGWSESDIAEYLKTGFTPEFDTAGGAMVNVIKNTSRLSADDRAAIAAYSEGRSASRRTAILPRNDNCVKLLRRVDCLIAEAACVSIPNLTVTSHRSISTNHDR
jgi:mono/diheme cytochrome c family protein